MTQKQILWALGAAVLVGGVALAWYFAPSPAATPTGGSKVNESPREQAKVPDTVDGIVESIEAEATFDQSALDAEASGSLEEIDADSESVNNFGTSYDENNL